MVAVTKGAGGLTAVADGTAEGTAVVTADTAPPTEDTAPPTGGTALPAGCATRTGAEGAP
ncbi:MAG TPA: hypothetical protein VGI96_34630 [Streptosporangiaceae bacterium]